MVQYLDTTYYIGHTSDEEDRWKASSGGIGTAITRYLLSQPEYGTSVTFRFNQEKCMYEPVLIYKASDINVCGSIYQEIDIPRFLKDNIDHIKGGIVVSCTPCQVTPVRQILTKNGIPHFIISFCCSGQTTIEGTWKYYELLGIRKEDVVNMQYRGNGWPSGIQIWLKDGTVIRKDNYTEPWVTMHSSQLYRQKKCFYCTRDTGREADIALADPWLKEYRENDHTGNTLFLVITNLGKQILESMHQEGAIHFTPSSYNDYAIAQKPNVEKELRHKREKQLSRTILSLHKRAFYFKWATKNSRNMHLHIRLMHLLQKIYLRNNIDTQMSNLIKRIRTAIRSHRLKHKVGSYDTRFNIMGDITITHPECIHLGKNVGIGGNTYLGPVTRYAGISYNPKIIIGEGTWVGKNCSIAAVDKVEIGKHVLFAGHVHITDHSHGYEDINVPITPQPLISKGPVIIEDDCWLGFSCEILSGVHIGKHCIVAARAVVTKDAPPYSIVAGNPARIVKRYNHETKQWERI